VALVRIAELNCGLIKRALDIGADGIVVPWIETAAQLRQAVNFANFPLQGVRGIGAERATAWGQCLTEHTCEANEHVLVVPVIETVTAGKNIKEICQVPGVELFFFGPVDYSASAGHRGQWEGPGVAAELLAIKDTIRAAGKHCGILGTSPENILERRQQGFQMLGLGIDSGLLLRGLHNALGIVGQDRRITPSFIPSEAALPQFPLIHVPDGIRPDRLETVSEPGKIPPIELSAGVLFDCLVGNHNSARGLTTGQVTFAPSAQLPYHTHPVSESVTLLCGQAIAAVEGREYSLEPLDNVTIPRGLAHAVSNPSTDQPAVFHVALASEAPARELVSTAFEGRYMPDDSAGTPGKERVTRFKTAARSSAGPGTSFIDYFNSDLLPGIEMSGGYGLFESGGRLPAHFHDFDESICIIQGTATCVVEGREYQMAGGCTALQPRGRIHYFANRAEQPMAMIWVYAGPVPDRIVVDERLATKAGDPWQNAPQQNLTPDSRLLTPDS